MGGEGESPDDKARGAIAPTVGLNQVIVGWEIFGIRKVKEDDDEDPFASPPAPSSLRPDLQRASPSQQAPIRREEPGQLVHVPVIIIIINDGEDDDDHTPDFRAMAIELTQRRLVQSAFAAPQEQRLLVAPPRPTHEAASIEASADDSLAIRPVDYREPSTETEDSEDIRDPELDDISERDATTDHNDAGERDSTPKPNGASEFDDDTGELNGGGPEPDNSTPQPADNFSGGDPFEELGLLRQPSQVPTSSLSTPNEFRIPEGYQLVPLGYQLVCDGFQVTALGNTPVSNDQAGPSNLNRAQTQPVGGHDRPQDDDDDEMDVDMVSHNTIPCVRCLRRLGKNLAKGYVCMPAKAVHCRQCEFCRKAKSACVKILDDDPEMQKMARRLSNLSKAIGNGEKDLTPEHQRFAKVVLDKLVTAGYQTK
ncbi:hypothetical protein NW762_012886 [Fusarium torreyae]|uniref:Uncharacterized protein n=1 Tax=Fusarium torreyae TaxID=1237075 RepID=A0A9W8RLP2_9HYPO|nr:hypothetical protein NW762_012886 [Fusarium torreyae]